MFRKSTFLWIILAVLALALAACVPGLPIPESGEQAGQVETAAHSTISAMSTQAAFETLVSQLTQIAQATATTTPVAATISATVPSTATNVPTQTPSNTPLPPIPTNTPLPSLTPVPPTVTPVPCYRAQFISDVTVPDGTNFQPNQNFQKVWRLKNIGSCNWNSDFNLYFVSGNHMSAPAGVYLNATVRPGDSIDLAVNMIAPNTSGSYTGNFMLRSTSNVVFGLGAAADKPFWVKINVTENSEPGTWDPDYVRDFAYNYCAAIWRTGAGSIPCPGSGSNFTTGSVTRTSSPVLEGGYTDDEMTIVTIPNSGDGGYISGHYPALRVKAGDRFQAVIGCLNDSDDCDVTFELQYKFEDEDDRETLATWEEEYDGDYTHVDVDLSALADRRVEFYLRVKNNGSNNDDRAFWLAPMIVR